MKRQTAKFLSGLVLIFFITESPIVAAEVSLPRLLGDGLVLQRNTANRIWGWADEGETVVVRLDGQEVGSVIASNGEWQVSLDPMPASGPHQLEIAGKNQRILNDVYFGDLWIASGQSNMELPMARVETKYGEEIANADYPLIRMFTVPKSYNFQQPQKDTVGGKWLPVTPDTVRSFSATAYFFAKEIHNKLGVAVGIISSSYGGSPAEGWMSEDALQAYPHYLEVALKYRDEHYFQGLLAADQARSDAWYSNADATDSGLTGEVKWFDESTDTSAWKIMELPAFLEDAGLEPINGVIWFKKEFTLPSVAAAKAGVLTLGAMVDADTTYVNGVEVGNTTYKYPPRRYAIKENILREGNNTITIRLTSNSGKGGFIKDKLYQVEAGDTKVDLTGPWRYKVGMVSEPLQPPVFQNYKQPMGFYNAMLAPLLNISIKGVIWYQGESNVDRPGEYAELFPAMIRDWRNHWDRGNFPFIYVQLANFLAAQDTPVESSWAETRDAQLGALREPNTAMVVTIDVGEWNDIHPLNKEAVGQRLALAARKIAYGESGLVYSGPIYQSMEIKGNTIVLEFEHKGSGLVASGDELNGFAVAGADGKFAWAEAAIKENRVVVWNDEITSPVAVRYAWADNPDTANLYNSEGLPASPFQASE